MEIKADVILKGTKVDGIYDADPMLHPRASRFDRISYLQVLEQRLNVMDATAISLCMDKPPAGSSVFHLAHGPAK